jgi:hypothetical protein
MAPLMITVHAKTNMRAMRKGGGVAGVATKSQRKKRSLSGLEFWSLGYGAHHECRVGGLWVWLSLVGRSDRLQRRANESRLTW